jgi:hypothetical protein
MSRTYCIKGGVFKVTHVKYCVWNSLIKPFQLFVFISLLWFIMLSTKPDSSAIVHIAIELWAWLSRMVTKKGRKFCLRHKSKTLLKQSSILMNEHETFSLGGGGGRTEKERKSGKLSVHINLVQRLRMPEAFPPFRYKHSYHTTEA